MPCCASLPIGSVATSAFIVASIIATIFAAVRPFGLGPRGTYVFAAAGFGLGSLVCGFAPNMEVMLAGRALQGFGAGLLSAMSYAMIRLVFPAGAALPRPVQDAMDQMAVETVGARIPMTMGLGMTETAPFAISAHLPDWQAGVIGLPAPGVEVKLTPVGDKLEVRYRAPSVMPGYWRQPELRAETFDDEGFFRSGDAARFVDPDRPERGLRFDGRIAEDFKLSTGTFVSVGPLKARVIVAGDPYVQDAVITGLNRDEIGVLVFPRVEECRRLAGLGDSASVEQVLGHPEVTALFQKVADQLWQSGTGSANRPARLHVMAVPPSIDKGEITDKGSINQRNVLTHRTALVDALYDGTIERLILPRGATS